MRKYPITRRFQSILRTSELSGQQPTTSDKRAAEMGAAGLVTDKQDILCPKALSHKHPPKAQGWLKQLLFAAVDAG